MSVPRLASRLVVLGLALSAGSLACALVAGLDDKEAYPNELDGDGGMADGDRPDGPSPSSDSGPVGVPQIFATGQAKPWGVAIDDAFVYWTNEGDSTVMRAPKSGGAPVVIARDQLEPHRILVDSTNIIWHNTNLLNRPYPEGGPDLVEIAELQKAAIGTSAPLVKLQTTRTLSKLRDLTMAPSADGQLWTAYDVRITRYRRDAPPAPRNVAAGLLSKQPAAVAVDEAFVYWFLQQPFEVWRDLKGFDDAGVEGGVPATLVATLQGNPEVAAMVADGTALYLVSIGGALLKVPTPAGAAQQVAIGHAFPKAMAQDDKYVYITRTNGDDSAGQGLVVMVAKAGDETKVIAQGLDKPRGIALDVALDGAHVVYWANYGDGTIRRERVR